ncbi:UDP-N-acetylmuramate dehydrogenase [Luteimonas pelagia]
MSSPFCFLDDAPLDARNTFGVPARAPVLAEVADAAALPAVLADARMRSCAPLVLGGGSNLLFAGDAPGPVLSLRGRDVRIASDDGRHAVVRADAGVEWHALVQWTLARGLCGLENLALIPGTVGAAPIQNIGAYGVEVGETIHAVEAYEPATGELHRLAAADCAFAYRDSLFKHAPDRFIVTAVEFALARDAAPRLGYAGITQELAAMGVDGAPSVARVAEAVVRIRRRKLPDPAVVGNAGSFFKNPIVPAGVAAALKAEHGGLPVFPVAAFPADAARREEKENEKGSGSFSARNEPDPFSKLSAAWLIDACGWKGHRRGAAGVSDAHALVLVNHGGATGAQLLALARDIAASVHDRFGVAIEPEPRIVGDAW